jgi:hypothetical protein
LYGPPIDYLGAYTSPQPNPNQLVPPPDGFAKHGRRKECESYSLLEGNSLLSNDKAGHIGDSSL